MFRVQTVSAGQVSLSVGVLVGVDQGCLTNLLINHSIKCMQGAIASAALPYWNTSSC
jgi:hypothetical protein